MNSIDAQHRSFRAWALQQNLISLLGGGSDWRANAPDLGLDDPQPRDLESVRGQAYLRNELQPDPRIRTRRRTTIALCCAVLLTNTFNQIVHSGLSMPEYAFTLITAVTLALILFASFVYPRLSRKQFEIAEQGMVLTAVVFVSFECSVTGGATSPYMMWFIFTAFYASYLMPERRAWINIGLLSAFAATTFFVGDGHFDATAAVVYATLVATSALICFTLTRQRRFESNMERAVQFLALADPLTSVANLRAFEQFTTELAQEDRQFAVVMADMNGLKGANAVFGNEAGDGMILRMSRLMMNASDNSSQIARIGGDEFAVILPDATRAEAQAWIERFEQFVAEHNMHVKGSLPQISAALGVAVHPEDGLTASELIDSADRAMYEQKALAVTPPYEIDVYGRVGRSHQLRAARFANAPRQIVETSERFKHAALNFLTIGSLLCASALTPQGEPAAVAFGLFLLGMAVLASWGSRRRHAVALSIGLDAVTIGGAYLTFALSGGAASPIQISVVIPVAFYAQYLGASEAWPRVALVLVGWSVAFWTTPAITASAHALYAVLIAASMLIAVVLQLSQNSLSRALKIVQDSATHDPLTKALNAHAFEADIAKLVAKATREGGHGPRPALLILDIDDFRAINTLYMHRGGDQILVEAYKRLKLACGDGTVYRTGGDEFAVLFESSDLNKVRGLAEDCADALSFRAVIDGQSRDRVSCSAGFAIWNVSLSADELIDLVGKSLAADKNRRAVEQPEAKNMML